MTPADRPALCTPVRPHPRLALVLVLLLVLGACTNGDGDDGADPGDPADAGEGTAGADADPRARAVAATVDLVLAATDRQAGTTADMAEAVDALCATPSPEALSAARDAWVDAVTARAAVRVHAVRSLGDRTSMAAMDWPRDDMGIASLLAGGEPVTAATLQGGAAGRRGLFALEEVLLGEGSDALADGEEARCGYADAVAGLVAAEAARLVDAVAEDALNLTGQATVSASTAGAVDQLVNQHATTADDLGDMWLPDGSADVTLRGPGAIADDWTGAIADALAEVYAADALGGPLDADLRDRLATATGALAEAAAGLDGSLDAVPAAERDAAVAAADEVRVLVRTEVVSALDVILTFSDNDGDSG